VRYRLFPLTEAELKQYIEHRLKTAGWTGDEVFSDEAVRRVYNYSMGIPRLINAVCDVALLAGYVAGIRRLDGECVLKAIQQLEGGS